MKYKGEKLGTIDTVIGIDVHITGDLSAEKDIRVDGRVNGNITSKSKVIIGEKAQVEGDIDAKNISVFGKVKGNIQSSDTLEIMETGEVYGELNVQKLYVALGGIVCGESKMHKQEEIKIQKPEVVKKNSRKEIT